MLMRLSPILVALGFVAVMATAQEAVPVRAVEHPEYSRLVLPLPTGADWSLTQEGSRATLRLTGPVPMLDVSSVFQRMPRTRVLSVTARGVPGGIRLDLALACACDVLPTPIGSGFLAIDVRRSEASTAESDDARRPMRIGAVPKPAGTADTESGEMSEPRVQLARPAPGPQPEAARTEAGADPEDAVVAAREQLLASLERAADEGLLNLAPEVASSAPSLATAVDVGDLPTSLPADVTPPARARGGGGTVPPALEAHLSIRGGDSPARRPAPDVESTMPVCIEDEALDVASWTAEGDFASGLGALRRNIVSPAGQIDTLAIEDLARFYIGVGFGREAQAVLRVAGEGGEGPRLLEDLARVVEGQMPAPDGPIVTSEACVGRVSLWRAASGLDPAQDDDVVKAVLDGVEELPVQLRRAMAGPLVRNALANGRPELARDVLEILDRSPGDGGAAEAALRASVLIAEGNPRMAMEIIGPALDTRSSPDPEVLLLQSAALLETGEAVPESLVSALDAAIAATHDGPGTARELRLARIRLEAADGRPVAALRALRRLAADTVPMNPVLRNAGLDILEGMAAEERRGLPGAAAILENDIILQNDARGERLRIEFAAALVGVGLPNAGSDLLVSGSEVTGKDARLIAAAAQLGQGDPRGALTALEGVGGEDAQRLKARAHLRLGDLRSAGDVIGLRHGIPGTDRGPLAVLTESWRDEEPVGPAARYIPLASYFQDLSTKVPENKASGNSEGQKTLTLARAALQDVPALLSAVSALSEKGSDP